MAATTQVTSAEWQAVAGKRILFGHQSVGKNILAGVQQLAAEAGVTLPVAETRSSANAGINHFSIGQNQAPLTKIKDFADVVDGPAGKQANIAMMKLCYIDFNGSTDAKKLADEYIADLERLGKQNPHITFVAITAPLTTVQQGPKAWVKRLMGRTPSGYTENYRRQEFNDILRARYGKQGRLFDLAKIEAEGTGAQYKGQPLETLNPAMTSDGGHLNPKGSAIVAARLIQFLATLP